MTVKVFKYYAFICHPDGRQTTIGGWTKESIKKDLADMERKKLIDDDCTVEIYGENENGDRIGDFTNEIDW